MYYDFFGFREAPFSIAPDPRYLYLSDRHKEALAHLMYGVGGQGGFIVITGEVGTGKTTVSRCFIDNAPDNVDMAIVLNPRLSARELLSSICDELGIRHPAGSSIKRLVDLINEDLLKAYAAGRHKVLIIDEAQNLSSEVLEQLRLLTNLETAEKKLLQIILLGQPELNDILYRPELRQLNQRVTARYHLDALNREELPAYLKYRLSVAGQKGDIFSSHAIKALYRLSSGVPRLINLISDRALLGAYAEGEHLVTADHIKTAAREVAGGKGHSRPDRVGRSGHWGLRAAALVAGLAALVVAAVVVTKQWPQLGQVETAEAAQSETQAGQVERLDGSGVVETGVVETGIVDMGSVDNAGNDAEPSTSTNLPDFVFDTDTLSKSAAFRALFLLWGESYQPTDYPVACQFAAGEGLECLHREGTRKSLAQLNRPAILRLQDDGGRFRYVTLASLEQGVAFLGSANGDIKAVRFGQLEDYWYGDFTILWRLPPYMASTGSGGIETSREVWLSSQLMQLTDRYAKDEVERSEVIAMDHEDQVRWYQRKKRLQVDGIPGTMTLIHINSDLNPGVPRLLEGREPGSALDSGAWN